MVKRTNSFSRNAMVKLILILSIALTIFLSMSISVSASGGIWDELGKYTNDADLQKEAANTVSPVIRFAFFAFAIMATIGAIIVAFGILKKALKVKAGRDGFEKKWIVETVVVLVIFIVIGGGSWIQFFKAGQELVVDPATKIITKDYTGTDQSKNSTGEQSQASDKK
ncbi:hypothetical protein [Ruminiclostridium cellobioparum]|uniref:hypothetical protein n=1 Tax=Ruminiclostridium cellobioparum TaxID=29355 RepID=UPI0028B026A6|nr:hypothetical protein [Ruminiclostridium cellobioparum]